MSISQRARRFIEDSRVETTVIVVIIANSIALGLETTSLADGGFGSVLVNLDRAFIAFFVVELLIKFVAYGRSFFRSPWNNFDFVVVAIALIPAVGPLSVLRALRVLRVLRLVTALPALRRIVSALTSAIPGMASIAALLLLVFYVAAVMATSLFGETFPQWFGSVGGSMYSLFQIMTLESWSMGIVRPVMEVHPWAWAFFVPFILVASFTVLNLFIAVIVDSMTALHRDEELREAADAAAAAKFDADGELADPARPDLTDAELRAQCEALITQAQTMLAVLDARGGSRA